MWKRLPLIFHKESISKNSSHLFRITVYYTYIWQYAENFLCLEEVHQTIACVYMCVIYIINFLLFFRLECNPRIANYIYIFFSRRDPSTSCYISADSSMSIIYTLHFFFFFEIVFSARQVRSRQVRWTKIKQQRSRWAGRIITLIGHTSRMYGGTRTYVRQLIPDETSLIRGATTGTPGTYYCPTLTTRYARSSANEMLIFPRRLCPAYAGNVRPYLIPDDGVHNSFLGRMMDFFCTHVCAPFPPHGPQRIAHFLDERDRGSLNPEGKVPRTLIPYVNVTHDR